MLPHLTKELFSGISGYKDNMVLRIASGMRQTGKLQHSSFFLTLLSVHGRNWVKLPLKVKPVPVALVNPVAYRFRYHELMTNAHQAIEQKGTVRTKKARNNDTLIITPGDDSSVIP